MRECVRTKRIIGYYRRSEASLCPPLPYSPPPLSRRRSNAKSIAMPPRTALERVEIRHSGEPMRPRIGGLFRSRGQRKEGGGGESGRSHADRRTLPPFPPRPRMNLAGSVRLVFGPRRENGGGRDCLRRVDGETRKNALPRVFSRTRAHTHARAHAHTCARAPEGDSASH